MALLEDTNACAICDRPVHGHVGGVPTYFCPCCYETYNEDIISSVLWVAGMLGMEKARRKRRNRLMKRLGGIPRTQNIYQGAVL